MAIDPMTKSMLEAIGLGDMGCRVDSGARSYGRNRDGRRDRDRK